MKINNRVPNSKIGFNDLFISAITIPLLALVIPVVFFNIRFTRPPYYSLNMYLTTLLIATSIWVGNRFIIIWARTKYESFTEIRKRLLVQSAVMLLFTLITNNLLGYLLRGFCEMAYNGKAGYFVLSDVLINSNSASLFCTLAIGAIYESRYYMHELKQSVEEKEMLKRESLQAQLNALRTQVNPHFLFNNLNTLCSIIPENPDQAVDFVQQLSKVYRHILEVKEERSIPLRDELEVLKAYSFLLKTRFGDNLNIQIDIAPESLGFKVVPLSLQLLLENAIKHNIVSADKPLTIKVSTVNGQLVVTNNLQKKKQISESTGIGLNNISNRYKLLSDKLVAISETNFYFTVSIPLIVH